MESDCKGSKQLRDALEAFAKRLREEIPAFEEMAKVAKQRLAEVERRLSDFESNRSGPTAS
jgi:hypothetical protein